MTRRTVHWTLLGWSLLACSVHVHAQFVPLRHFDVSDGLAQSQVTSIVQDSTGYLWFGTLRGGVSRYNGTGFHNLNVRRGLPGNGISTLSADLEGGIWIAAKSGRIEYWDGQGLSAAPLDYAPFKTEPITGLWAQSHNTHLVAVPSGLWRCQNQHCRKLWGQAVDKVLLCTDLSCGWALSGKTLLKIGRQAVEPVQIPGCGRDCRMLAGVPLGPSDIWVGTAAGRLYRLRDGRVVKTLETGLHGLSSLAVTGAEQLWIGTSRGLFSLSPGQAPVRHKLALLGQIDDVRALTVDREGSLWIATNGDGVYQRPAGAFPTLTPHSGLPSPIVAGFAELPDGTLYLAVPGSGVVARNGEEMHVRLDRSTGLPDNQVSSLEVDVHGGLWIGTSMGLARVSPGKPMKSWDGSSDPAIGFVTAILSLSDGSVYVSTLAGLYRFQEGRWKSWKPRPGVPTAQITSMAYDQKTHTLWLGTLHGLVRFDGTAFHPIPAPQHSLDNRVWAVLLSSAGRVWVGSEAGIWSHSPSPSEGSLPVGQTPPLAGRSVWFLLRDRQEQIWAGTTRMLFLLNSSGLVKRVFSAQEALAGGESVHNAAYLDPHGNLWFGSTRGATLIDPLHLPYNRVVPPLVLERVQINDKPIAAFKPFSNPRGEAPESLQLSSKQNDLRFEFSALSFASPEKVRYQWQLQNYDPNWSSPEPDTHAMYRRVPPGEYSFKVRASNNDSVWSLPLTLDIRIYPPWYKRTWFLLLSLLLSAVLISFVVQRKLLFEKRQRRKLEHLIQQRTAEIKRANRRISEQNKRLEQLTRLDPLTGLANRRALAEQLLLELAILGRKLESPTLRPGSEPLGLALYMIDLDHFKDVNDRYGHQAGDAVLKAVSKAVVSNLREIDMAVRWGGEELTVLARNLDREGLLTLAKKLLKLLNRIEVHGFSPQPIPVHASIGFIPYPLSLHRMLKSSEWMTLIELTDRYLYLAKNRGRARACGVCHSTPSYPAEPETELIESIFKDPLRPPANLRFIELTRGSHQDL